MVRRITGLSVRRHVDERLRQGLDFIARGLDVSQHLIGRESLFHND